MGAIQEPVFVIRLVTISMSVATLNMVNLDRRRSESLQSQLYRQIRELIFSGQLKAGNRLPSTRDLEGQLGVSRNTIVYALDRLVAEGYLTSRIGSGIYVSDLRIGMLNQARTIAVNTIRKTEQISKRASRLLTTSISPAYASTQLRPFRPCQPAIDKFPMRNWNRARSYALRLPTTELFGEGNPAGLRRLRQALSIYLHDARGVRCSADQIVITAGTQQALSLIGAALIDPGDSVWIEDPGYLGARAALLAAEAALVPIPVDDDGMTISVVARKRPRLIYVTPSRQFPLGVTMSLARRLALLDYARRNDAWIIEDDYDSEFRYVDRPLPSLQGLTDDGRVIYTGSFSKVLFPSLRLGYLVLPQGLVEVICKLKEIRDAAVSTLDQATAAVFLEEGFFSTHLRRMRKLYRERLEVFLDEARKHTAGWLTFSTIEAGMDAMGRLQSGADDAGISQQLAAAGISVPPVSAYSLDACAPGLLFGFTAFSTAQIRSAMKTISKVIGD